MSGAAGDDAESLRAELAAVRAEVDSAKAKLRNAIKKGKLIESERNAKDAEIKRLNAKLQARAEPAAKSAQDRPRDGDGQRLHDLESENRMMQEALEAAAQTVRDSEARAERAEAASSAANAAVAELKARLAEKEGRLAVVEGIDAASQEALQDLQRQVDEAGANTRAAEQARDEAREAEHAAREEAVNLNRRLQEAIAAKERAEVAASEARDAAAATLREQQSSAGARGRDDEIAALRSEAEAAQRRCDELSAEASAARDRESAARREMDEMKRDAEGRRRRFAVIQETFGAKESSLKTEIDELSQECEAARAAAVAAARERDEARGAVEQLRADVAELRSALARAEKASEDDSGGGVNEALAAAQAEAVALRERAAEARERVEEVEGELERAMARCGAAEEAVRASGALRGECEGLRARVAQLEADSVAAEARAAQRERNAADAAAAAERRRWEAMGAVPGGGGVGGTGGGAQDPDAVARINELSRRNKELAWQVAMLSGGEVEAAKLGRGGVRRTPPGVAAPAPMVGPAWLPPAVRRVLGRPALAMRYALVAYVAVLHVALMWRGHGAGLCREMHAPPGLDVGRAVASNSTA
ncbi:unnamed protein product [Pedinophyceae sp. YPF-701]|nr:unnamed protein product [Pedinophyceae sp. YPF-701]